MAHTVTKVDFDDLLEQQLAAERAFMTAFSAGTYGFDDPMVVYNPYDINPCAALVLFCTEAETAVTVTVRGKEPAGDLSHTYPPARVHILPVLGLYDNWDNQVDITLYQGPTKRISIRTTGHPAATKVRSMAGDPAWFAGQLVILTPALAGLPSGFDYRGDLRWYLTKPMAFAGKRLQNGHFMIGTHRKLMAPYNTSGLYEMDMVGKIYAEYRIPGLYHHDQIELENGDLLVLTQKVPGDTVEDVCVQIDRENGQVKREICYKDFLPVGAAPSGSWSHHDWFHNNALFYDPNTNSLTISGRHMDALVNIDYDTEQINWIIGDPEGWPAEMQPYFLTPVGEDFAWQYEQHAVLLAPDGDVLCFDNGHWRSKNRAHYMPNRDNYSRGVRYRMDLQNRTIQQVWFYGRERGPAFYSQYICNVEYYGGQRYLVHSGGIQRKDGQNVEGFVPPELYGSHDVYSQTVEVWDNRVLWELTVEGNFYRATKLDLYTPGSNLTLGAGRRLGQLFQSPMAPADLPAPAAGLAVPADCCLHVLEDYDNFSILGRFADGSQVVPYLQQGERALALDFSTAHDPRAAGSCLPYIPTHPACKSATYSKRGLAGDWRLYLLLDGTCYDTGVTIAGDK